MSNLLELSKLDCQKLYDACDVAATEAKAAGKDFSEYRALMVKLKPFLTKGRLHPAANRVKPEIVVSE